MRRRREEGGRWGEQEKGTVQDKAGKSRQRVGEDWAEEE